MKDLLTFTLGVIAVAMLFLLVPTLAIASDGAVVDQPSIVEIVAFWVRLCFDLVVILLPVVLAFMARDAKALLLLGSAVKDVIMRTQSAIDDPSNPLRAGPEAKKAALEQLPQALGVRKLSPTLQRIADARIEGALEEFKRAGVIPSKTKRLIA